LKTKKSALTVVRTSTHSPALPPSESCVGSSASFWGTKRTRDAGIRIGRSKARDLKF